MATWAATSLFWINYAQTPMMIATSHGFYDHFQTVSGWPIVYRYAQLSTPQSGMTEPEFTFVHWRSSSALALDIAAAVVMVLGVASVCSQLCPRLTQRRFSLAGLCWAVMVAAMVAGFIAGHEHPTDLAGLLGGNLDGPRIASLAWYPWWLLTGVCFGAVCGAVLVLHAILSAARMLMRARDRTQAVVIG